MKTVNRTIQLVLMLVVLSTNLVAQTATEITVPDTRTVNTLPNGYANNVKFEFKTSSVINANWNESYTGLMTLAPWYDSSGGKVHQLGFYNSGISWRTGFQVAGGGIWDSWRKLVLEDANGNVGIGTAIPYGKLGVNGSITTTTSDFVAGLAGSVMYLKTGANSANTYGQIQVGNNGDNGTFGDLSLQTLGGYVGIGTPTPTAKLDVRGNMYLNAGIDDNHIYWGGHNMTMGTPAGDYNHNVFSLKPGGATNGKLVSYFQMFTANSETSHNLKVLLTTEGVSYLNGGNVGIGTTTPTHLLSVNGSIRAKEVIVDLCSELGDFVFHPTYNLMPLTQVEQYVKTNSHLPQMPSAAEVSKSGMNMGEMQNKLLQKVEELTLYIIEQSKRIEQQNACMKMQQNEINQLKLQLSK